MHDRNDILQRAKAAIAAFDAGPTPDDIEHAPLADLWRVMEEERTGIPVIWGRVSGHPTLGTDDVITSRLIGLDRAGGWARTLSRWYRLGTPFMDVEARLAVAIGRTEEPAGIVTFELPGYSPLDDEAVLAAKFNHFSMIMAKID